MKCTNKAVITLFLIFSIAMLACGCAGGEYSFAFDRSSGSTAYTMVNTANTNSRMEGFTKDLCVDFGDYSKGSGFINAEAGGAFNLSDLEVLYGKNLYNVMNPASLTKIMTAHVALKYGNLSDRLVVTDAAMVNESGAQLAGLKPGDTMTLEQAVNIMLVCSANDAALAVAQHVGGDVDTFVGLMNAEAKRIGATSTHFTNPHGLTDENHKTTPYDLYLILNEAVKDENFRNIINQVAYNATIMDANGNAKEISVETTNLFLKGSYETPADVVVLGGKTGTTAAAGSCLAIYAKDTSGKYYITVILHADDREMCYLDTASLLTLK